MKKSIYLLIVLLLCSAISEAQVEKSYNMEFIRAVQLSIDTNTVVLVFVHVIPENEDTYKPIISGKISYAFNDSSQVTVHLTEPKEDRNADVYDTLDCLDQNNNKLSWI